MADLKNEAISLPFEASGLSMPLEILEPTSMKVLGACIVLPEIFGITPAIKEAAERIAGLGYCVAIPDLNYRTAPQTILAEDDQGRAKGLELLHAMTRQNVLADIGALRTYLDMRIAGKAISILGFSAGGHIAYLAATAMPFRVAIALYAGWIGNNGIPLSQPEPTVASTHGIAQNGAKLIYMVGSEDRLIRVTEREQIADALKQCGVDHRMVIFDGVSHGFMIRGRAAFDERACGDAWVQIETALLIT